MVVSVVRAILKNWHFGPVLSDHLRKSPPSLVQLILHPDCRGFVFFKCALCLVDLSSPFFPFFRLAEDVSLRSIVQVLETYKMVSFCMSWELGLSSWVSTSSLLPEFCRGAVLESLGFFVAGLGSSFIALESVQRQVENWRITWTFLLRSHLENEITTCEGR